MGGVSVTYPKGEVLSEWTSALPGMSVTNADGTTTVHALTNTSLAALVGAGTLAGAAALGGQLYANGDFSQKSVKKDTDLKKKKTQKHHDKPAPAASKGNADKAPAAEYSMSFGNHTGAIMAGAVVVVILIAIYCFSAGSSPAAKEVDLEAQAPVQP